MEQSEVMKLLETPVGDWLNNEELWLPKDGNSIKKWLDAERVGYEMKEEKYDNDHVHTVIQLKGIPEDRQEWAFTYVLSLIAMKYFVLNKVRS